MSKEQEVEWNHIVKQKNKLSNKKNNNKTLYASKKQQQKNSKTLYASKKENNNNKLSLQELFFKNPTVTSDSRAGHTVHRAQLLASSKVQQRKKMFALPETKMAAEGQWRNF